MMPKKRLKVTYWYAIIFKVDILYYTCMSDRNLVPPTQTMIVVDMDYVTM